MSRRHKLKHGAQEAHDTVHDLPRPHGALPPSAHEALLRLLADESHAVFWAADAELRSTLSSGFTLPTPDGSPLLAAQRQALAGQPASCEVAYAGLTYRATLRPVPGPGKTVAGCIGVAFDVTPMRQAQEALVLRGRLIGLLNEVGAALASAGPSHETLQRVTTALARRLGATFAGIWTLSPGAQVLELQAAGGDAARLEKRCARVAIGRLRIGLVAQAGQPSLTNDLRHDARIEDREWALREGVASFAGQPLIADGRVVGVLAVFARGPLDPTTLDELSAVAGPLAQYVERRRLEHERGLLLQREREARDRAAETIRRSAFLAEASLALDSLLDYQDTLERIARLAVSSLADWCLVDVVEEGGSFRRVAAAADLDAQEVLDELVQHYPPGRHAPQPAAQVLQTGEPLLFSDCPDAATLLGPPRDDGHARLLRALRSRSLLALPLCARGQLFGAITLVSTNAIRRYDAADLALAGDFARRCALVVDNVRLLDHARREADERRWAEETLLKSEEHLRQASKMEAVGRLAEGVAHDFNNILMAILGYTELLQTQLPTTDPAREVVNELRQAGERAAQLTRQLLTFGRTDTTTPRQVNLNHLLANLESMLRRLIDANVRLVTIPGADLGPVLADPGQLEQAVVNLVVNACDAMPQGGRLTIETRNVELDDTWAHLEVRPGPHVLLAVSDTGHGMTEEVRRHLFEPFFTTRPPGEGTGLGLAIVYGIVTRAGGHIDVVSSPGAGAAFRIYLPRADAEGALPEALPEWLGLPDGMETVLLAEDDAVIRTMVTRALQGAGYQVLEAADGEEALRVAASHRGPIQLLLTDMQMPHLGGRETAARLLEARPGLRVLYVSAYSDAAVDRQGSEGADSNFLPKPFTPQSLVRKVRAVLDG